MKTKTMVLGGLIICVLLLSGYEYSSAQSGEPASKIGVMSVERVLRDCRATAKYREQMKAEGDKMNAEMDKLSKEIQALRAGLQLGTLKVGSSDYFKQHWELAQKQAELDARKEYIPNQQMLQQPLVCLLNAFGDRTAWTRNSPPDGVLIATCHIGQRAVTIAPGSRLDKYLIRKSGRVPSPAS